MINSTSIMQMNGMNGNDNSPNNVKNWLSDVLRPNGGSIASVDVVISNTQLVRIALAAIVITKIIKYI